MEIERITAVIKFLKPAAQIRAKHPLGLEVELLKEWNALNQELGITADQGVDRQIDSQDMKLQDGVRLQRILLNQLQEHNRVLEVILRHLQAPVVQEVHPAEAVREEEVHREVVAAEVEEDNSKVLIL